MKTISAVIVFSLALQLYGAEDVKKLIGMLDTAPTPSAFLFAAKKLGELREISIVPKLTARIDKIKDSQKDEDLDLIEEYVGIIAELKDKDSVSYILDLAGSKNARVKRVAFYALGELGDEKVFPNVIKEMLIERDFAMKREALTALSKMGLKELAPIFAKSYFDQDPGVRAAIIAALRRLKEPLTLPMMKEELKYENNDWLKERLGSYTRESVKK